MKVRDDTLDERIKAISKEVGRGFSVSEERVFGLYVAADAHLAADIEEVYHASYEELPSHTKRQVLAIYDKQFGVTQMTQYINERRLSATELAFAIEGQHSGVALREPQPADFGGRDYKGLAHARGVAKGMKPMSSHVAHVATYVPETSRDTQAPAEKPSYAARYATPIPDSAEGKFTARISAEELAAMDVKGRG